MTSVLRMINRLIELSLQQSRSSSIALYVGARRLGLVGARATPIDAIPDLSDNQVIVFTDWAGTARRRSRTRSPIR